MAHSSKYGYPHTSISDNHKCKQCGKGIKVRLVMRKTIIPTLCYKCYKNSSKHGRDAWFNANNIIRNN